jgi:hypothetical protein
MIDNRNDNSRWFEPRRRARSERLKEIVRDACQLLGEHRLNSGGSRNSFEQDRMAVKIEAVISDLLHSPDRRWNSELALDAPQEIETYNRVTERNRHYQSGPRHL